MTTCGLLGGPETDEYGSRCLYVHITNLPAEIESIIQPDVATGKMDMSITGNIKESRVHG